MFYKVRILGTQDTLLDELGTHYFFRSYIQGSVDFIFGKGRSRYQVKKIFQSVYFFLPLRVVTSVKNSVGIDLKQECVLRSTANRSGAIAAHHRNSPDDTGFSFVNCTINGTGKIYLGRAWGNYSRAIYSYCSFDDIITPPGWTDWNHPERQKYDLYFIPNSFNDSVGIWKPDVVRVLLLQDFGVWRIPVLGKRSRDKGSGGMVKAIQLLSSKTISGHAIHRWRGVAETMTLPSRGRNSGQFTFAGLPLFHLSNFLFISFRKIKTGSKLCTYRHHNDYSILYIIVFP